MLEVFLSKQVARVVLETYEAYSLNLRVLAAELG
jgi:hypothetical protein